MANRPILLFTGTFKELKQGMATTASMASEAYSEAAGQLIGSC